MMQKSFGVWFPAIQTGTGTDLYTVRLVDALNKRGIKAAVTWLPPRAEYIPWLVPKPRVPDWADIVHVNSWLHPRFIPEGLPVVATLHSCVHDECLSQYKSPVQSLYHENWIYGVEKRVVDSATLVTAVSKYTAAVGEKVFGRKDIVPVYNWIDTDLFIPAPQKQTYQPFRLLFVGSVSVRKGADLLHKIMDKLGDEFELLYTGEEGELVRYGPIPPNIRPVGRVSGDANLVELYKESDALLFPSRLEGFGLVALEAGACGIPVIASRSSSLPEVVLENETGLLCDVDDVDQYVAAARRLMADPGLASRLAHNARARAEQCFSEDEAVNCYLKVYRTALTGTEKT